MEPRSALGIAHGLNHTQFLKSIDVSGNPIGKYGMRLMLQSISRNQNTNFKVNLKNISAETDIKDSGFIFDPENPEGKYALDLKEAYDQICL